jgi:hypothetical protein
MVLPDRSRRSIQGSEGGDCTLECMELHVRSTRQLLGRKLPDDLWTEEQVRRAQEVVEELKTRDVRVVRFSFADQHGILRGA